MIKQLIINGKKSYDDFDLYISERTISQPKKKSIKESVPFSNVVYDFSDINGEIYWEERTLKYVFDFAELSTEEMEKAKSKVLTWLMNVHDTDIYDPYIGDYHFRGSFESDSWSEDFGAGTLTINFSVYPYKISNSDTSIIEEIGDELTGSSPLTINNSASDDLESLTIYGNSEQVVTEQSANVLDLTKYTLSSSGLGNHTINEVKSNEIKFTISGDCISWAYLRTLLKFTENGKYTYTFQASEDCETNLDTHNRIYGYMAIHEYVKGTNTINKKYENSYLGTTKDLYYKDFDVDIDNYDYYYIFYPTANSPTTEEITFHYEKIGILKGGDTYNHNYVEFVPDSPDPDYISGVKNVSGVTNEFNINLIPSVGFITNNGDGTLTLAKNTNTVGYAYTETSLSTLMPNAKVGETYKLLFKNTFSKGFYNSNIYLSGSNVYLTYGNTFVLTQEMLDSKVVLYGGYNEVSTISDFIITKDINCDSYVPYGGKYLKVDTKSPNLYNFKDKKEQTSGVSVDEDGWITCTYDNSVGSKSKYLNYYTNNLDLKTNTDYIVVVEIKEVTGQGNLYPFSNHSNGGQFSTSANLDISKLSNGLIRICKGKTRSSFSGIDYGIRSFVEFPSGKSGSITFRLSVLEDITITADKFKYSSFGKDYILIDMKKPNLFDYTDTDNWGSQYYVTLEIIENGLRVTSSANGTYKYGSIKLNNPKELLGKTLSFSCNAVASSDNIPNVILYWANNLSLVSSIKSLGIDSIVTIPDTMPDGVDNILLLFYANTTNGESLKGDYVDYTNIKLYRGNNSDDYYELLQIGDVKDELILDGSTTKIVKKIEKYILSGVEGWSRALTYNEEGYRYYFTKNDVKSNPANDNIPNIVCDTFKSITPSNTWYKVMGITILKDSNNISICFESDETETLNLFKAWLSENPVTIYYELNEPYEIELTNVKPPKTFDDGTIITINDELEVDIDVTYNEKKTLIIDNISSHRVTPKIMVEGDLTIELNNTSYGLSTGVYNNGLYLESGINEVILRGTGKIKFSYVEEVL